MNNEKYLSLYDFLGRAAGSDLGIKVAAAAAAQGVQLQERQVSNPKYTGKIVTYPVSFLENYFNGSQTQSNNGKMLLLDHKQHKDLPF